MFLAITHNNSGSEYIRRMAPNENKNIEYYVEKWVDNRFEGEATIAESDGYIPRGCGEYYAEIRHTKKESGTCYESMDFYVK